MHRICTGSGSCCSVMIYLYGRFNPVLEIMYYFFIQKYQEYKESSSALNPPCEYRGFFMDEFEIQNLKDELNSFRQEKEKIRRIMEQVGGARQTKQDAVINIIFITAIVCFVFRRYRKACFSSPCTSSYNVFY